MRVLSLYCGAGGIDEGLRQAGIKTTVAIDIWKDACETMKLNHDCDVINGKVSEYENSLNNFDLIVGGPPCQTFSYNNPNRKNDMEQVKTFIRIVEKIKPRFYLMENVRGLFKLLDWNKKYLVKFMNFGVPQNRTRVFYTNLDYPSISPNIKSVTEIIETKNYKFIFKSGNTHQNRKVRTKTVDGLCDTVTASDRIYLTNHQIVSEKYGFNFNVPKEEITLQQYAQLQGFPKDYKFYGSQSSVRKQIGNAVPSQPIKAFAEQITLPIISHNTSNDQL